MATVHLLQQAYMRTEYPPFDPPTNFDRLIQEDLIEFNYHFGTANPDLLWLLGSGFESDMGGSVLPSGTIATVCFDQADDDTMPNVLIEGLSKVVTSAIADAVNAGNVLSKLLPPLLAGQDLIIGSSEHDDLWGFGGDDVIRGRGGSDGINGGTGKDTMIGGMGADYLIGATGGDTFVYRSVNESSADIGRDVIKNFDAKDVVDVSAIDANTHRRGNQAFEFIGANAFTGNASEFKASRRAAFREGLFERDA